MGTGDVARTQSAELLKAEIHIKKKFQSRKVAEHLYNVH